MWSFLHCLIILPIILWHALIAPLLSLSPSLLHLLLPLLYSLITLCQMIPNIPTIFSDFPLWLAANHLLPWSSALFSTSPLSAPALKNSICLSMNCLASPSIMSLICSNPCRVWLFQYMAWQWVCALWRLWSITLAMLAHFSLSWVTS